MIRTSNPFEPSSLITIAQQIKSALPGISTLESLQRAAGAIMSAQIQNSSARPWSKMFTVKPVLTVDHKLVWLCNVMYRRKEYSKELEYMSVTGYITHQLEGEQT